jgi:hypothetical protein
MTMQPLLATAAILALVTGVVHSFLGERLIFRHLRVSSIVPTLTAPPLQNRHVRILWATWHLASVLAWAFAGLLWQLARASLPSLSAQSVLMAAAAGFIAGSLLVLFATRGRHPGWIALAVVGALSWASAA